MTTEEIYGTTRNTGFLEGRSKRRYWLCNLLCRARDSYLLPCFIANRCRKMMTEIQEKTRENERRKMADRWKDLAWDAVKHGKEET